MTQILEPAQSVQPIVTLTDILTLEEAAQYLRVATHDLLITIDSSSRQKFPLPCQSINGQWRFRKSAIDQWLSTPISNVQKSNVQKSQFISLDSPEIAAAKRRSLLEHMEEWKTEDPDREAEDTETYNLLEEALQHSTLRRRSS